MKKVILLIGFCFSFMLSAQKGAYYQQYVKYKMNIDVDASNYSYHGKQSIEYTNNSPDELRVVYFHLYWNAFKPNSMMDQRVTNQGLNADSRLMAKVNGKPVSRLASIPANEEGSQKINWIKQKDKDLKFEIQETIMKVYLNEPLKPNSTTTFTMDWDAVIPHQIRRAGRNNREGVEMSMSQWYPKIAEYDYDGWATFDYVGREFHAPFGDFDVTINIDKDYVIGAGGTLQNPNEVKGYAQNPTIKEDRNGKATWRWRAKNILDFAWAADPDFSVEEMTVIDGPKLYFVYQKSEKTKYWEEAKPLAVKFFQIMNATFGRYTYPSYSFIQGGDGGMEYGMCTLMLGEARNLEGLVSLMVHEGAHSWYQQMLATNESVAPWLDEGFTSYAQDFVLYRLFPPVQPQPNPFTDAIQSYVAFTKRKIEEPAVWLADHHDHGSAYSVASYTKGELFLVELGYIVGEENLSKIMRKYYDEWSMKHPTGRDFMHIAQKVSGMDLKWFYHYWINTTKTIDYAIKDVKYGDGFTTVTLVNKGTIPMPIDFSVLTKDNKIVNYHIPLNMMREPKKSDFFGNFTTLGYWNWTANHYTFTIPFGKEKLQAMGIDFTQRLADVNPEDNFLEVK